MGIESLHDSLKAPVQKVVDALKAAGASEALVYGPAASGAIKPGDDITIAVKGLDEDHLLKVSGRMMMDHKISVDLCDAADAASAYAKSGGGGNKVL